MISAIVPIYNEEEILRAHSRVFAELSQNTELIFVDGKSGDKGANIAGQYGRVLQSEKGRAKQMNTGAREARNDILLFLHADNVVSSGVIENIEKEIRQNGVVGGCLTQKIDKEGFIFRLIEAQGNNRARRSKIFYGDQGIFVRKDVFEQLGGFPDVPIFEDVLFARKLKNKGGIAVLLDKIMVSARRWEKNGIIKTTLLFNLIILLFRLKVPLHKITQFYEDIR